MERFVEGFSLVLSEVVEVFLLFTVESHDWAVGLVFRDYSKLWHRIGKIILVLFDVFLGNFKLLKMVM